MSYRYSVTETLRALSYREFSAEELVGVLLRRIEQYNPGLMAYVSVFESGALTSARHADEQRARGQAGPLCGVPIAVKDLIDVAHERTTYGGRHLENFHPAANASVVNRLVDAGAIIIGKTNLHEYAYGTTTENPHFGDTRNPWNRGKISGGSSGGSSAAIVAGLCAAALGTDTGGSIRIPAALTGHVGFKPTHGLVSTAGVFPLAGTLDHVGPMTKSVQDARLLLSIMAGYDPADPRSVRVPIPQYDAPYRHKSKWRIGVPKHFFFEKCHPNVLQTVQSAMQRLEQNGFELVDVEIPLIDEVPTAQAAIITAEAHAVHGEWLATAPHLYGPDVRRRLEMSASVTGGDYVRALQVRRQFIANLAHSLLPVDALITPTTPLTATDLGQTKAHIKAQEVQVRAHLTRCTNPWNTSGLPAVSIPCGQAADGLPVGLQFVSSRFADHKLLSLAQDAEAVFEWDVTAPAYRDEH